jgi:hypothetical protein
MTSEKFQIVAFTTNETKPTPNDILKIFLNQHTHTIKVQSAHAIQCEFSLQNKSSEIMMISISDLNRTYDGICDVSFYFLFVYLQNLNAQKNFESTCAYMKKYCDLSKKVFIFGILNDDFFKREISEEDINIILGEYLIYYEYYEIELTDEKQIGDNILKILLSFSQKRDLVTKKEGLHKKDSTHSCVFY